MLAALRSGLMFWLPPLRTQAVQPQAITQPLLPGGGSGDDGIVSFNGLPRRDARRAARAMRAAWAAAAAARQAAEEAEELEAGRGPSSASSVPSGRVRDDGPSRVSTAPPHGGQQLAAPDPSPAATSTVGIPSIDSIIPATPAAGAMAHGGPDEVGADVESAIGSLPPLPGTPPSGNTVWNLVGRRSQGRQ